MTEPELKEMLDQLNTMHKQDQGDRDTGITEKGEQECQ